MKTILVIDDEEILLEILKEALLDALGSTFQIETISTQAKVEEYLSEHAPDYIISETRVHQADMRYVALLGIPTVFYSGWFFETDQSTKEITICKPANIKVIIDSLFKQAG